MPLAYSDDLKWRIIYLYYDNYSISQIMSILYISKGLVRKVLRLYKKWGTITNPWRQVPGQQKTFNRNDMNILRNIIQTCILMKLLKKWKFNVERMSQFLRCGVL